MSTQRTRLDRIEGRRNAAETRRMVDGVAARHGLDAGSVRAEADRILARAAADGWSPEEEIGLLAAETGRPVAEVRVELDRVLAEMIGR